MKEFCYKIDNTRVCGYCQTAPTHNGFKHDCELYAVMNGEYCEPVKVSAYYLNRTWERFEYQSVLLKAIRTLQEEIVSRDLTEFKRVNHYMRMTAKRRIDFDKFKSDLSELNKIYKTIKEGSRS